MSTLFSGARTYSHIVKGGYGIYTTTLTLGKRDYDVQCNASVSDTVRLIQALVQIDSSYFSKG